MQRVRVGLTGLAAIFLLVMIAAAGIRPSATTAPKGQTETLAMIGVAPSSGVQQVSTLAPAVPNTQADPKNNRR